MINNKKGEWLLWDLPVLRDFTVISGWMLLGVCNGSTGFRCLRRFHGFPFPWTSRVSIACRTEMTASSTLRDEWEKDETINDPSPWHRVSDERPVTLMTQSDVLIISVTLSDRQLTLPSLWGELTICVTLCERWDMSHPASWMSCTHHLCGYLTDESPCRLYEMNWPSVWVMRDKSPCAVNEMYWPSVWH